RPSSVASTGQSIDGLKAAPVDAAGGEAPVPAPMAGGAGSAAGAAGAGVFVPGPTPTARALAAAGCAAAAGAPLLAARAAASGGPEAAAACGRISLLLKTEMAAAWRGSPRTARFTLSATNSRLAAIEDTARNNPPGVPLSAAGLMARGPMTNERGAGLAGRLPRAAVRFR